ncbi:MAG TPA: peptide deformylase [Pelolinea sp.]|nr:peptide deformylase [Pelolinea sp.]
MALRDVIKLPHPVLRRKAHRIINFGIEFQQLVEDMIETMRAEPGVGLAAPQVSQSLRVIVVEYPEDDTVENAKAKLFVLANPEFTFHSEETVKGIEGCLSVPNLLGEVDRSREIVVEGQDKRGKNIKIKASGWLARIIQHEVDHLNGVLFVDRAETLYQPEEIQIDSRV